MINSTESDGNRQTKENLKKKRFKNRKHFNGSWSWESKEKVNPEFRTAHQNVNTNEIQTIQNIREKKISFYSFSLHLVHSSTN